MNVESLSLNQISGAQTQFCWQNMKKSIGGCDEL